MRAAPLIVAVLVLAGCAPSGGTTTAPSSSQTGTTAAASTSPAGTRSPASSPSPTALDDLASFLEAAGQADAALHAAATQINASVGGGGFVVDDALAATVTAADPSPVWSTLPAGIDGVLLDQALTVWSGLVNRWAAMSRFAYPWSVEAGTAEYDEALACLGNGSDSAAGYTTQVAALAALAAGQPTVAPDTDAEVAGRDAAELAVVRAWVVTGFLGCDACGGAQVHAVPEIVWESGPTEAGGGSGYVGPAGGVAFEVRHDSDGWQAVLIAC